MPNCKLLGFRPLSTNDFGKNLSFGFEKLQENLDGWNREVGREKANVQCVLFFTCDEKVCTERCLDRGAAGSRRTDDNEETLKKRFLKHNKHTIPVVEYFRTKGLVRKIDTNRSIQDVFADVTMVIDEILK